jgi:type IV fimbrial biogenesis protein FimT
MRSRLHAQRGFTAVEGMIVVAILAILAAFAAPAMNGMIRAQKVRTIAYDLFADLTFTRSQAIARGRNVALFSSSGLDWVNGWAIRDLTTGEVIRQQGPRASGVTFTANQSNIVFDRSGRLFGPTTIWAIAPTDSDAPDSQKRCVRISPSGRPNTLTGPCP